MTVIRCAQGALAADPSPEQLVPLLGPLNRLREAVRAGDEGSLRSCAEEVARQRAAITWACEAQRPAEIRELGAALAWLTVSLDAAGGGAGAADISA